LNKSDLLEFARRDWHVLADLKSAHWARRKRNLGPTAGVTAGEELRLYYSSLHPAWPTQEDRRADLETHARVSSALRSVLSSGSR
jgi:hypothetical protein